MLVQGRCAKLHYIYVVVPIADVGVSNNSSCIVHDIQTFNLPADLAYNIMEGSGCGYMYMGKARLSFIGFLVVYGRTVQLSRLVLVI